MTDINEKIEQLLSRIEFLNKKQSSFIQEIHILRLEIEKLKSQVNTNLKVNEIVETPLELVKVKKDPLPEDILEQVVITPKASELPPINEPKIAPKKVSKDTSMERYIGENLISKIGIVITVIGAVIGAKYAIDNELISPIMRIILGYVLGLGLLGIGLKLKTKYLNFSSVLISGAMAINYFITFAAYDFYQLIPQIVAFGMMVVCTIFTVIAAISYDKPIIAHLGLVGAYTIPFMLSTGSGKVEVLFSYIAIINVGILIVSFKKYWKSLYFASFIFTWLIYLTWFSLSNGISNTIASVFLITFFLIFYATALSYKILKREVFVYSDIVMILSNAFVFFGIGYALLLDLPNGDEYLGLFTLANAVLHFIVGLLIRSKKLADEKLSYLTFGLVISFITLAFPIQLDGHWVTLFWLGESVMLFWLARSKHISMYGAMSYPIMLLGLLSGVMDVVNVYEPAMHVYVIPFRSVGFITFSYMIGAFTLLNLIHFKWYPLPEGKREQFVGLGYFFSSVLVTLLFACLKLELLNVYSKTEYHDVEYHFGTVINQLYHLLFVIALALVNIKWIKSYALAGSVLVLNLVFLLLLLGQDFDAFEQLNTSYISGVVGVSAVLIRWLTYLFVGGLLAVSWKTLKSFAAELTSVKVAFDLILSFLLLLAGAAELNYWSDVVGNPNMKKIVMTIYLGAFACSLIVIGILKGKSHLRIGALVLFGITLIKLFFVDIIHRSTIYKTVVFVALGILLLLISFLYNKFKDKITNE